MYTSVLRAMKGQPSNAKASFTSFRKGPNKSPPFLRLCLECANENRGETYWRRTHQLPCVHACHRHGTALGYTSIPRGKPFHYISAEDAIHGCRRGASLPAQDRDTLLWLSQQAQWLLDHPQRCLNREFLRDAYLYRLYQLGFASVRGTVRMNDLSRALSKKYLRTGLSQYLNLQFTHDQITRWMKHVIGGKASTSEHLVALHFLELPVSSLVESLGLPIWFEPGPWPCLNPLCRNYKKDVIDHHDLMFDNQRLIGTFTCVCGFVYERIGPDKEGAHRHAPRCSVPNETFDEAIRDMCARRTLSLTAIKEQLFTSYREIEKALNRLCMADGRKTEIQLHTNGFCPATIDRTSQIELEQERKRNQSQAWQ